MIHTETYCYLSSQTSRIFILLLLLIGYQSGISQVLMEPLSLGAKLTIRNNSGVPFFTLTPGITQGSFLDFQGGDLSSGIEIGRGANFSTIGPTGVFKMEGLNSSTTFRCNLGSLGPDFHAELPDDAINAIETEGESGVVNDIETSATSLTSAFSNLAAQALAAPISGGSVMAIATAEVTFSHTNGTVSSAEFGISRVSSSVPTAQDIRVAIPSDTATGTYKKCVTVHGTFDVGGAGAKLFFFLGKEFSGNIAVDDVNLSLVFLPTAYGTIDTNFQGETEGNNEQD